MSHYKKFSSALLALSLSDDYETATKEWGIYKLYTGDGSCLCHKKIVNQFEIINKENGNKCIVGSVCIDKFMNENKEIIKEKKIRIYNAKQEKDGNSKRKCLGCIKTYENEKGQFEKCEECLFKWFKGLSAENQKEALKTVSDELKSKLEMLIHKPIKKDVYKPVMKSFKSEPIILEQNVNRYAEYCEKMLKMTKDKIEERRTYLNSFVIYPPEVFIEKQLFNRFMKYEFIKHNFKK